MIIPIGLIYLFIIFTLRNKETFIKLSVGFLPLSLITLHNYIYGGKFVLLTSSAFIPANYHVHFDWYFKMFYDDTILQKVLEQIAKWSHDYNILLLLVFAVLLFAVFTFRRYSNDIKLLILASLGSQLPLFFWHASGRYSYLAWLLSFVLCISIIHFYIQKYKQSHNTQKKKTHTKRKHTKKRKK
jgi:preprotein translocase subunit YajC